jgi:hypothetical protein
MSRIRNRRGDLTRTRDVSLGPGITSLFTTNPVEKLWHSPVLHAEQRPEREVLRRRGAHAGSPRMPIPGRIPHDIRRGHHDHEIPRFREAAWRHNVTCTTTCTERWLASRRRNRTSDAESTFLKAKAGRSRFGSVPANLRNATRVAKDVKHKIWRRMANEQTKQKGSVMTTSSQYRTSESENS